MWLRTVVDNTVFGRIVYRISVLVSDVVGDCE